MIKFEASRHRDAVPISLPRYRAAIRVYTPAPDGGDYVINVDCRHQHVTAAQAEECADRLARYIERHAKCPEWADDRGHIAGLEV